MENDKSRKAQDGPTALPDSDQQANAPEKDSFLKAAARKWRQSLSRKASPASGQQDEPAPETTRRQDPEGSGKAGAAMAVQEKASADAHPATPETETRSPEKKGDHSSEKEAGSRPAGRRRSGARRGRKRSAKPASSPPQGAQSPDDSDSREGVQAAPEAKPASPSRPEKEAAARAAEKEPGAPPAGRRKTGARKGRKKPDQAAQAALPAAKEAPPAATKLLINSDEPEECRIALLENGKVESFHVETLAREQTKGNIYKGRITAVEPNLQAAFVDIGTGKNGFLPFSDIHPEYYSVEVDDSTHWKDLKIQEVVRKGQEVLVEVVKEASGGKGANMTTYLSLPGRYLVLMPGSDSAGISRKIEDEEQRAKLRELVSSLKLPEGIGYIVRTASAEITKKAITEDAKYLLNLWNEIKERGQAMPAPSLIYKEQNIISRFLRDHFTGDIQEIMVDTPEARDQVQHFLNLLPVKQRTAKVRLHHGSQPLFSQFKVEEQIEQIYQPKVSLPSGGSIVINPTEALVAIDVNSGRTAKDKNFEETIFLANMEAAEELGRQLRLRDLGGLIVVDFIDMRDQRHIREVEKQLKNSMKRDKAKVDFSRISKFGLMQISRQKMASPIQLGSYRVCDHCQGRGLVRSVENQALVCLRLIHTGLSKKHIQRVECRLPTSVAQYLLNKKREDLLDLEKRYNVQITIEADPAMTPADKAIELIRE